MNIERQLYIIRRIQAKHPTLSVGGSIGLHLHGINLHRDLSEADLDMCSPDRFPVEKGDEPGSGNDFDASFKIEGLGVEVRFDEEVGSKMIDGICVTDIDYIIRFKKDYARKGYKKHQRDLIVMNLDWE